MRRVLSALALVLLVLGLSPSPAPAKGPTNMLLVAPASGDTAFMTMDDPRYAQVESLLDDLGEKVSGRGHERWHEVQVAWTVQALDIFRADIVFLDGEGAAVAMTVTSLFDDPRPSVDWRRVQDGEALTALFDEMGLLGGSAATQQSADTDGTLASAGTPASAGPSPVETDDSAGGGESAAWRWALPALLAGLVLGGLGTSLTRRRTAQVVAQRLANS